jgi:hypothetical protein
MDYIDRENDLGIRYPELIFELFNEVSAILVHEYKWKKDSEVQNTLVKITNPSTFGKQFPNIKINIYVDFNGKYSKKYKMAIWDIIVLVDVEDGYYIEGFDDFYDIEGSLDFKEVVSAFKLARLNLFDRGYKYIYTETRDLKIKRKDINKIDETTNEWFNTNGQEYFELRFGYSSYDKRGYQRERYNYDYRKSWDDFWKNFGGGSRNSYGGDSHKQTYATNWWSVLGFANVPTNYNEIKTAYRKLVLKYHPDRTTNEAEKKVNEEKLKEINSAFAQAEKYFKR